MRNMSYLELLTQIDDTTLVITANTRLKDHLTAVYLDYASTQKQYVMLRDSFMNFDGFINTLYNHAQMLDTSFLRDILQFVFHFLANSCDEGSTPCKI